MIHTGTRRVDNSAPASPGRFGFVAPDAAVPHPARAASPDRRLVLSGSPGDVCAGELYPPRALRRPAADFRPSPDLRCVSILAPARSGGERLSRARRLEFVPREDDVSIPRDAARPRGRGVHFRQSRPRRRDPPPRLGAPGRARLRLRGRLRAVLRVSREVQPGDVRRLATRGAR